MYNSDLTLVPKFFTGEHDRKSALNFFYSVWGRSPTQRDHYQWLWTIDDRQPWNLNMLADCLGLPSADPKHYPVYPPRYKVGGPATAPAFRYKHDPPGLPRELNL